MTSLTTLNTAFPAHLQNRAKTALSTAAAGGINSGGFTRITIGGGKFHLDQGDEKTLIRDPHYPDAEIPLMDLAVVIISANPDLSKLYYEKGGGEDDEQVVVAGAAPDCSSEDGITPDQGVKIRQADHCATCPQNAWGSRVSKNTGKPVKACRDQKSLVVLPLSDLETFEPTQFVITPSALKDWREYVKELSKRGIELNTVATHFRFDTTVTYPKVTFHFGGFLTEEQQAIVDARLEKDHDEIERVATPRKIGGTVAFVAPPAKAAQPAAPAAPSRPAPAAPVVPAHKPGVIPRGAATVPTELPPAAPAAPAVAPAAPAASGKRTKKSEPATPQGGPYDGLPPHVQAAVEGAGGLESPSGIAVYTALAGKAPPAAPAAVVDPFSGLPAHVKAAVDAAGGLGTPGGDSVFAALGGKAAAPAPAPAAPVAPAPAAPAAPAGSVKEIDDLLEDILGGAV